MRRFVSLAAVLLLVAGPAPAADEARLLRFPTIHGDDIVFTYAGNLYSVPAAGGTARRLTSHDGFEMFARFSPDGKQLAFTGQYDGNTEVYLMPAEGGVPKRLTYTATLTRDDVADRMGPNNIVMGWKHDDAAPSALQAGGNMEGKEVRFGIANSSLFTTITTDASCGAVNTMHDSLLPLGGMVPMVNIMLGEIIFGGVGSGLYGMLLFAIVAVFVAGLMVGRTPEYLGKKIEAREVKMAMLAILILPLSMLGFTAIAVVVALGLAGLANSGPHGFSEALYAYTSATGNNGSAFAGLSANTPFWNTTLGLAMWIGRFFFIVPMLAIAGSLAGKKIVPASAGTFPTDGGLFVGLLIGVIMIIGGLTFFPALALGPIEEHLAMYAGSLF